MQEISEEEVNNVIHDIMFIQDEINEAMNNIQKSISEIIDQIEILKTNWTTDGGIKSINQIQNTLEKDIDSAIEEYRHRDRRFGGAKA